MNQTTIFDVLYPKYKITKPIRLIELFAGYGSQYLALKYLGANVKHYKICEWATKSIQAYNDLHIQDYFDYSGDLSDDNILKILIELGVSINYNEPATREQLKRQNFRKIYNNIIATNNLVNIQNAKGEDFKIVNKDQYEYIMTYSFPCQDLSLAGKGKGMVDTSTRSGMLWEVERILNELKTTNSLPQILLMENVPQVHGFDNVEHFNKWQLALENMGYKNYFQDLIATNYGIPQTRNRCFMVSILGEYSYTFPKPIPLELKLKDMLEDEVDEKYYLSDKQLNYVLDMKDIALKSGRDINDRIVNPQIAKTISCRGAVDQRADVTNFTIDECDDELKVKDVKLRIKEETKKGYKEAYEGDGVNISSRIKYQRGNVQKDSIQTLTTSGGNDKGVVISNNLKKDLCNKLIKYDIIKHSYTNQILNGNKKCVEKTDGNMITLTTRGDCYGVCVNDENQTQLRIRKLTPLECFRLMGVKDEDYYKVAKNQSNSSLYHLAGDSIVVNVLMAIFKELIK